MRHMSTPVGLGTDTAVLLGSAGVEIRVWRLPEAAAGQDVCFTLELHDDGSHCAGTCDCGREGDRARTVLWVGETITVGAWSWRGGLGELVGWRRIGPSEAETELRERAEVLAEDLEVERGNHRTTNADLVACIRRLEKLQASLDATSESLEGVRASLRLAREVLARTERQRRRAAWAALAGWTVAAVLALALWAVVA